MYYFRGILASALVVCSAAWWIIEEPKGLVEIRENYIKCFTDFDAKCISELYSVDAKLEWPGIKKPIKGKTALMFHYKRVFDEKRQLSAYHERPLNRQISQSQSQNGQAQEAGMFTWGDISGRFQTSFVEVNGKFLIESEKIDF